ncbi:hypothetical protein BKG82_27295 [Mycobacteroides chelonae]|uniref:Transglycosylase SLT domain-containing protein n=1 Tax=Mycobacteroides chelonae TaxID=1774 RepID=A0A1S1LD60_MYCCH|nr:hypothetical protein [Mycobacteroides chelonae]OHU47358.1 hypothetical protein BKG82_27295 [Mycobacteroides chelonae]
MTQIQPQDRAALIRLGLTAAGVPKELAEKFGEATADIVRIETDWQPDARAANLGEGKGPDKLFGDTVRRDQILADGRPYRCPRGLTQLTPHLFDRYRAPGTRNDIDDPVASIAALWLFIADNFNVNLTTGSGLAEFRENWRNHRADWWWLTELAPFNEAPRFPGY